MPVISVWASEKDVGAPGKASNSTKSSSYRSFQHFSGFSGLAEPGSIGCVRHVTGTGSGLLEEIPRSGVQMSASIKRATIGVRAPYTTRRRTGFLESGSNRDPNHKFIHWTVCFLCAILYSVGSQSPPCKLLFLKIQLFYTQWTLKSPRVAYRIIKPSGELVWFLEWFYMWTSDNTGRR